MSESLLLQVAAIKIARFLHMIDEERERMTKTERHPDESTVALVTDFEKPENLRPEDIVAKPFGFSSEHRRHTQET